jgi:hypothetical protein
VAIMDNFCTNCGSKVIGEGRFCSNCGLEIENTQNTNTISSNVITVNNVKLNTQELINDFGKDKIGAIKFVHHLTKLSLKESKKIVDEAYDTISINDIHQKKSFKERQSELIIQDSNRKKQIENRKKENELNGVLCCSKCGSASLSANKKGFGVGKAIVGTTIIPGLGLLAGALGSKKINITCLECGYQFKAGKK